MTRERRSGGAASRWAAPLAALVGLGASSGGAVLTPTTYLDEDGTNPAACSVREAVRAIELGERWGGCPRPTDGIIELGKGVYQVSLPQPITFGRQPTSVSSDGLILRGQGPGATSISGSGPQVRSLLRIWSPNILGTRFELHGLRLTGAHASAVTMTEVDGLRFLAEDVVFEDNRSQGGAAFYIQNSDPWPEQPSSATFRRVRFERNLAIAPDRPVGGALFCSGSSEEEAEIYLRFEDVVFRGNEARLERSSLSSTASLAPGEAEGGQLRSAECTLSLSRVAFVEGVADPSAEWSGGGGAAVSWQYEDSTTALFENVTFAGNSTKYGGGLLVLGSAAMELLNVTFVGNSAPSGGDHVFVETLSDDPVVLVHNVLFGEGRSAAADCAASSGPGVASSGGNLDVDGSCKLVGVGDQAGIPDPGIETLATAGQEGSTATVALRSGSVAIDHGVEPFPAKDQRGRPRPFDGDGDGVARADVGAFELAPPEPVEIPPEPEKVEPPARIWPMLALFVLAGAALAFMARTWQGRE